ncbi:MAG: glycerol-3-phosphate responsive antiterminator [Clostridia bacterium]|nr:glycerol-3-phosphate responsive antiterminator [Clostridia bacterium]
MRIEELTARLETFPIIAAVQENKFQAALEAPVDIIFCLEPHLLTIRERTAQAHAAGKLIFVHLAMAVGIGQDKEGMRYLADCGVDGIISTKGHIIRTARELGVLTVQRFFALDSQGIGIIQDTLKNNPPHLMEIMPGVIPKAIKRFADGQIPVIAGGLIETRQEVTAALSAGALAVSTGCKELWYE